MNLIKGINKNKITMNCMDEWIAAENPVRVIDALVEELKIDELGFAKAKPPQNLGGRPSYLPKDLLKLYLYGYNNRIRSSRMLGRECTRNMEVRWLINRLVANYHTIADFRKDHRKQLINVFKKFTSFLLNNDLLNGDNVAVDGTKVRVVNAKKNNFNFEKVNRHLEYIDNKTEKYFKLLDTLAYSIPKVLWKFCSLESNSSRSQRWMDVLIT